MNEIKSTTLRDRIRKALRALRGEPDSTITYGMEIKRCSACYRGRCEDCEYKIYSQRISALPDCNTCAHQRTCPHVPRWGEIVRINCHMYHKRNIPDTAKKKDNGGGENGNL